MLKWWLHHSFTSQSCKASWLIRGLFSQRHFNSSFPDFLGKPALPKTDYILVVNNMAVLLHQHKNSCQTGLFSTVERKALIILSFKTDLNNVPNCSQICQDNKICKTIKSNSMLPRSNHHTQIKFRPDFKI